MTIKTCKFRIGDVYLFHATDPGCDSRTSLWGIVGDRDAEDPDLSGNLLGESEKV